MKTLSLQPVNAKIKGSTVSRAANHSSLRTSFG